MRGPVFGRERQDSVILCNHQRRQRVDLRLLRRIVRTLLLEILDRPLFQLEIHILGEEQITRLNEEYVHHRGVTDVIAFDYSEPGDGTLRGEVFACLPEAFAQARRFRTSWQRELVRYLAHAVLHLCGYDDQTPAKRRVMKRAEDDALRRLSAQYFLEKIAGPSARPSA